MVLVSHAGSFWKWRLLGGFVTLAEEVGALAASGSIDVVLASSMLHLPAFLGMTRRHLDGVPVAVYFHESQFSYPVSPLDRADETYGYVNWASAAAADLVLFNSAFHLERFFEGARALLRRFPDHRQGHLVDGVVARSEVLEVGVDLGRLARPRVAARRPSILWNQRWEHDKAPGAFVAAMLALAARGIEFDLILAGERFVSEPPELDTLRAELGPWVIHDGYASDDEYPDLLAASDIVVSTALQEFFGVAITEAVFAGAFPVLPHRLVYPERIPESVHHHCLYGDEDELLDRVEWAIANPAERTRIATDLGSAMGRYDWAHMAPRYDSRLAALVSRSR